MQLHAALEVIIRLLLKGQSTLQQPSVIFSVRPHIPLNGGAMLGSYQPNARCRSESSRANDVTGIARGENVFRHVPGDYRAGSDDSARANRYAGKDKCARADERIFADRDLRCDQRHVRVIEIVASGAQVGLLRDRRTRADLDLG